MTVGYFFRVLFSALFIIFFFTGGTIAADRCRQIVVLGDPHLPGTHLEQKEKVRETINGWNDVELVAVVGDITETRGTDDEYADAKKYFAAFHKPLALIGGNHDYLYDDRLNRAGKKIKAGESVRANKLAHFRQTFNMPALHFTKIMGRYLLVFMTVDDLDASTLATISKKGYEWLFSTLRINKNRATIIFFHAPLEGTLGDYRKHLSINDSFAQPAAEIKRILAANPQVFIWVSGHTHTPPGDPNFASGANLYEGRIINIHNTDMKRAHIYTNSLFLCEDRVVVKTFDHKSGTWMTKLERTVPAPHSK
jgi:3',5'-cyclic-AMP phosphodiesterase